MAMYRLADNDEYESDGEVCAQHRSGQDLLRVVQTSSDVPTARTAKVVHGWRKVLDGQEQG